MDIDSAVAKKCLVCGSEVPNNDLHTDEFCDRCRDNPERRRFYDIIKNNTPSPQEPVDDGHLLTFPYFCDENGVFKPARVAVYLNDVRLFKTDRASQILYYFDEAKKKWSADGESKLQELLATALETENRKCHYVNVLHDLKGLTQKDVKFSKKIALKNGLLDAETGVLSVFSPAEMPFHSMNVTLDGSADCPKFKRWLPQAVRKEDIPMLQEWSGFLLLPNYCKHKIMWLIGEGRNGKGVWTRTMEGILGEDNCSSVGLEDFSPDRRFALYQLYGKLFNPCNEPSTSRTLPTQNLKRITGQDTIDAEIKCKQQRIKFRNAAKATVIGNRYPKIDDTTTAFWERVELIEFPFQYIGTEQIDDLEDVWLNDPTERSGILNWMLEGLHRLLKNNDFTRSKTAEQTKIQFKRVSDTIGAFLIEQCVITPDQFSTRTAAYDHYKTYADEIGATPENDRVFAARLRNTPRVKEGKKRIGEKTERVWLGLGLKPFPEETDTEQCASSASPTPTLVDYYPKNNGSEAGEADEAGETLSAQSSETENIREREIHASSASCASKGKTTATDCVNALTLDDLKAVYWAEGQFGKKLCCVCGCERETSWTAETFKGEQKPLCEDCFRAFQEERG